MAEVLVVDDERAMREGLKVNLQGEGFDVRTARDGEDAVRKIAEKRPDLVLLDVMMPKMNGFRCCEMIRKSDDTLPVVFLTAKDAEGDQLRGLGLGADDFVSKTASESILMARVKLALSRVQRIKMQVARSGDEAVQLGPVVIDLKSYCVKLGGEVLSRLTRTEMDIFKILVNARGELVVADDIITQLRGSGFACEDVMLYVHFSNLRRKLGPAADWIVTKRGVGYTLKR